MFDSGISLVLATMFFGTLVLAIIIALALWSMQSEKRQQAREREQDALEARLRG
jgi:preprotein translocase subunit SecG